ncbi:MAG: alpha-1,2-fucosyltransferase [Bdellovibrionota bacterium]
MNKLVVVNLIGGLGNQMFQYAVGKALAKKLGGTLKVDIKGFETYFRSYDLNNFKISAVIATQEEVSFLKSKNLFFKTKHVYKEKTFCYDSTVFNNKLPVYLEGYWQSEKYFKDIRQDLLSEFQPKNSLSEYSQGILTKIRSSKNSVSIHIRRGDYLKPQNQQVHGVCSLEYYQSAIQTLSDEFGQSSYFIFSDDIDWAKSNLNLNGDATFIDENTGNRSFEDILLMSACEHNIIANSSFSWWGAWLNQNANKKVIAPLKWFATQKIESRDIYAQDWTINSL